MEIILKSLNFKEKDNPLFPDPENYNNKNLQTQLA